MLTACGGGQTARNRQTAGLQTAKIREAVSRQVALYPESTWQDLYKAFFQAEFGAGHMIADTAAAGAYLDAELTLPDASAVWYEPVGADSAFFRVHLRAVQEGHLTRDLLFQAFTGGVTAVDAQQIEAWKAKWAVIAGVIEAMDLNLKAGECDRAAIDSLLAAGFYAVHHSETFSRAYDPHYRIVRKDIFERDLLPFLFLK